MYTPAIILRASGFVLLWAALSCGAEFEDLQKPEEDVPLELVAGIPYGSISGRVADYFATLKTPLRRKDYENYDSKNSDLNGGFDQQLDEDKI
ncbi:hypothetical protein GE061_019964 [Apolygus lucorum]|uniref:Uncharacterized protein n=1 Tax=Apolygus lucorum TaxID=248454 RepID=A0A6A4JU49_APOLU|nr:hypothetical protein GE061_019964 [Apolygus lucorum]